MDFAAVDASRILDELRRTQRQTRDVKGVPRLLALSELPGAGRLVVGEREALLTILIRVGEVVGAVCRIAHLSVCFQVLLRIQDNRHGPDAVRLGRLADLEAVGDKRLHVVA